MEGGENNYPGLLYNTLIVGIGEYKTGRSPDRIRTVLGSCVGVIIYDEKEKLGGIAHVYLPYSHEYQHSPGLMPEGNKLYFADLLIPRMLADLRALQSSEHRLKVYLTGGAYMLKSKYNEDIDVGKRNLSAARAVLQKTESLLVRELLTGGNSGQTVFFNLFDGGIDVKLHKT